MLANTAVCVLWFAARLQSGRPTSQGHIGHTVLQSTVLQQLEIPSNKSFAACDLPCQVEPQLANNLHNVVHH